MEKSARASVCQLRRSRPSLQNALLPGAMGAVYGIPKEFIPHIPSSIQNSSVTIPKGPRRPPANIYRMRSTVIGSYSDGTTKVQIAVIAATMTTGVPTMPALTAASPTMSAATRLTEWPMGLGRRSPASRTISSRKLTNSASINSGSGVASSADATLYSSSGGSSSGVKFATDTNTPGSITAMRNAEYFRMRISDAKYAFSE